MATHGNEAHRPMMPGSAYRSVIADYTADFTADFRDGYARAWVRLPAPALTA